MRFSIIIPVYNVEKLLAQCVESVLQQNFEDYEIILVDDGSPDRCPQICDSYANQFQQIRVIHKKNGGLSDARNAGLRSAKGEYIFFLDSDDYWEACDILKECNDIIERKHADIIRVGIKKIDATHGSVISDPELSFEEYEDKNNVDILESQVRNGKVKIAAYSMVLSRDFLLDNKLFFKVGIKSEDLEWAIRLFSCNPRWGFYPKNMYIYREGREGSITSTIDYKHLVDYCDTIETSINNLYQNHNERIRHVLTSYLMYHQFILIAHTGKVLNNGTDKMIIDTRNKLILKKFLSKNLLDKRVKFFSFFYCLFGYKVSQAVLSYYLLKRGR